MFAYSDTDGGGRLRWRPQLQAPMHCAFKISVMGPWVTCNPFPSENGSSQTQCTQRNERNGERSYIGRAVATSNAGGLHKEVPRPTSPLPSLVARHVEPRRVWRRAR